MEHYKALYEAAERREAIVVTKNQELTAELKVAEAWIAEQSKTIMDYQNRLNISRQDLARLQRSVES